MECLPSPVPVGKDNLKGRGGRINNWKDWFDNDTCLSSSIKSAVNVVKLWWEYTNVDYPGTPAGNKSIYSAIIYIS